MNIVVIYSILSIVCICVSIAGGADSYRLMLKSYHKTAEVVLIFTLMMAIMAIVFVAMSIIAR